MHIVIAPDGHPCEWTRAQTKIKAIAALLGPDHMQLWPFAEQQGYRLIALN